jgi:Flp pilus assembly protein TadD
LNSRAISTTLRAGDKKECRMPLPLGSLIRFTALLGWAGALAACGGGDPQKTAGPAISKELVEGKDDSLLRVAEVARDSADYPSAIRLYRTMLQSGDTRAEVHVGLADTLFLTGAYTEAAVEYRTVDEHSPKIADAEIGLGRIFLAQHKPADAAVQFQGALARLPADTRALNGAGVAFDNLGRHDEALAFYERGLAVAPNDRVIRNNYGLSLALSGKYAQAIAQLRPLVDEPGATARNRQNLALALALSGARGEAQKVAGVDLDAASVSGNLRFYDALRAAPAAAERELTPSPATPPVPAAPPAPAPATRAPAAAPQPAPAPPVALAQSPPAPVAIASPPQSVAAPPPAVQQPIAAAVPPAAEPVAPPPVAAALAAPEPLAAAAAPPPASVEPTPAETKGSGQFALQLAVYQRVSSIAAGWQKYKAGFADVVGSLEPRVAMVDLGDGRGPLYRLKAGPFHSASAAQAACQKLKSAGSDCKVSDFDGAPAQEYWKEHQIE